MNKLYLIRHGETDWNIEKRLQGHSNTSLNAKGLKQASFVSDALKGIKCSAIYSSKLKRAIQTSDKIAEFQKLIGKTDPRLNEINLGEWEGKTYDEIMDHSPGLMTAWYDDPIRNSPPGGETLIHLKNRVASFLSELSSNHQDETIFIVSHGGAIRLMICELLGLGPEHHWNFRVDNTSISIIENFPKSNILIKLNDTHHLINS